MNKAFGAIAMLSLVTLAGCEMPGMAPASSSAAPVAKPATAQPMQQAPAAKKSGAEELGE